MTQATTCPMASMRDDRKSAAIAAERLKFDPNATTVSNFAFAREILRNPAMEQNISGFTEIKFDDPEQVPLVFLDGELHRKRRSQLSRFFTPKAIKERHTAVMQRTTEELISQFRKTGRARLDLMSMELACDVAAEIVGLTDSNRKAMAKRIRLTFVPIPLDPKKWLGKLVLRAIAAYKTLGIFRMDVMPAIRRRRKERCEDVISYLLDEGYSDKAILIECMTYATAGMLTTREFIVMVAWHLFERDDLREQFLNGGEDVQFAILDELLRLEPVAALVYRKAAADMVGPGGEQVKAGDEFIIDMRAANIDEEAAGACPLEIDPGRGKRQRIAGAGLSFGDGAHRCPGSQVALHETRVFIDALFRVPGIRLANPPTVGWCDPIMGYELHHAFVECDPA